MNSKKNAVYIVLIYSILRVADYLKMPILLLWDNQLIHSFIHNENYRFIKFRVTYTTV